MYKSIRGRPGNEELHREICSAGAFLFSFVINECLFWSWARKFSKQNQSVKIKWLLKTCSLMMIINIRPSRCYYVFCYFHFAGEKVVKIKHPSSFLYTSLHPAKISSLRLQVFAWIPAPGMCHSLWLMANRVNFSRVINLKSMWFQWKIMPQVMIINTLLSMDFSNSHTVQLSWYSWWWSQSSFNWHHFRCSEFEQCTLTFLYSPDHLS